MAPMIVLFTDFGLEGPYTGQVKTVLHRTAPGVPVIDLFADLPAGKALPAAYLLAAYGAWFSPGTVILAVVDPGVGGAREAVVVDADGRSYVGPDNGLFEIVARRADRVRSWAILPGPAVISASFHGRDLFAPVAGQLARGDLPVGQLRSGGIRRRPEWPDDLAEIAYIDRFGNAMTGLRAALLPARARLAAAGRVLTRRRTFSDVPAGEAFWYENSNGLAEIAVNSGRADAALGLVIGTPVDILP
jgi:S-adenosyl-L-methionine hydrolase (adenosine-forming)